MINPKTFSKQDNYTTPKYAIDDLINEIYSIVKDKVIYEPFYNEGASGEFLRAHNLEVIHNPNIDFYNVFNSAFSTTHFDLIISNPPYSNKSKLFKKLQKLNKPFILLLPINTISTQMYKPFREETTLIIPKARINFIKDGKQTAQCTFDTAWYCYKVFGGFNQRIIYLSEK